MDYISKLPRGLLIILASAFFGLTALVGNNLYADSQSTKKVAYQAKNIAETASLQISEMRGAVQDIQNKNETFRREYREDQNRLNDTLKEILLKK